jgi:hypothetical protein
MDDEEGRMTRKKGKSVSFDAMVKFFIQSYGIPTKKDIERLEARLDRIEHLVRSGLTRPGGRALKSAPGDKGQPVTALETVLDIIKQSRNGTTFKDIQNKTGYNDKKIRNVIFRLNKLGRIERKSRGIYVAS